MLASVSSHISNWTLQHFPIWHSNRTFVLIVLAMILCTLWYWFWTRSKAAVAVFFAELLYLMPFVR